MLVWVRGKVSAAEPDIRVYFESVYSMHEPRLLSICNDKMGITALLSALLLLLAGWCSAIDVSISEVKGYTHLASYKNSTLYRVQPASSDYETNPLLLHLVGSRYGRCNGWWGREGGA